MKEVLKLGAAIWILALATQATWAQGSGLTLTTGVDYAKGKYNTNTSDNWTWTIPFIVKYETGPITLKINVPYVRTHGVNRDVGDGTGTNETQSGLGDVVASSFYSVLDEKSAGLGLDLGIKIKFATADREKDLITTGNNDYSLQADLFKTFGAVTAFGAIGWTNKGDIRSADRDVNGNRTGTFTVSNPKNPWYASVGGSYKLTASTSVGLAYDWREKLFSGQDDISEGSAFVNYKLDKNWKLQGYGVAGFSHASPDWGLGATVGYGF